MVATDPNSKQPRTPRTSADGLTPRQEKVIVALLNEATIAKASVASGVPERTIHSWFKEAVFERAYRRFRRESFGQAIAMTQRYAPLAVNTLAKIMADPAAPAHARVAAAATVLRFAREGIELDDLAARVSALEDPAHGEGRITVTRFKPLTFNS